MIIGGAAVALHGYFRYSRNDAGEIVSKPDFDIWYNPHYDNYYKVLNALEALGQDVSRFKNEKTPKPKQSFFKLNFDEFTLDLLPVLQGDVRFHELYLRRETLRINEIKIDLISIEDLIANKIRSNREKDLEDVIALQNLNKNLPHSNN